MRANRSNRRNRQRMSCFSLNFSYTFKEPEPDQSIRGQIVIPGGGVFFFWQLGVVSYIHDQFDLSKISITGASAGAVSAACAAAGLNPRDFIEHTLAKCDEYRLWDRPLGLFGVLGKITEEVLEEMLPEDAAKLLQEHNVNVLIKPMQPKLPVEKVSRFGSRESVIKVLTASAHIPLIANGKVLTKYHGKSYIDGALFAKDDDFLDDDSNAPVLRIDYEDDPAMQGKSLLDCVRVPSKKQIWEMYDTGREFAKQLHKSGDLDHLNDSKKKEDLKPFSDRSMSLEA